MNKTKKDFIQWLKETGRTKYELTDIYVNDNGEIKTEKIMAWVSKLSPEDWYEFCKATGRKYVGDFKLLADCR